MDCFSLSSPSFNFDLYIMHDQAHDGLVFSHVFQVCFFVKSKKKCKHFNLLLLFRKIHVHECIFWYLNVY